ncbi:guanine nucleotide-binding protein-like 3 homolog isoform X2 [Macrobrachium rosenbergii]|uniref:guanine nucleotide-binding protein-like 3 homolog isoform X1 n=1 Tax=Macrobrachium rosenbergii TaxID=79674 RepID=UPI0034D76E0D
MVKKKRQSKRLTLKKKYRILKNKKESKRKKKREMKRHPEKFPKPKDPGIPLKLPFYKDVIDDLRASKEAHLKRLEEAKQRRKEMKNQIIAQKRNIGDFNINELLQHAKKRGENFDKKESEESDERNGLNDRSARAYYREFKKVVEAADVVLEVLDARDPLGTRVPQLEAVVTGQMSKKLVLVLNKADLVPRENLEKWLKYLRREYPTIVFKSSTQVQGHRLGQTSAKIMKIDEGVMHTSKCLGADVLMQLMKNYCRNKDIKTSITVGVVGLPNVGKSSLINSLKRSKSCGVGATPGFTKSMQEIILDSKVKLLDCPGIVLPGKDADDATAALRNAVKIEELQDLFTPVDAILKRADKSHLMIHYRLADYKSTDDFLALLAKRFGKLKKQGIPDKEGAARRLLHDWNSGVIKYYTQPPETSSEQVGASLTQELSAEFDIDSLRDDEGSLLKELPMHRPSTTMKVSSLGPVNEMEVNYDECSDMEEDDDQEETSGLLGKEVCIDLKPQPEDKTKPEEKKARWETQLPTFNPEEMSLEKFQKKMMKKARKEKNRNVKRIDGLLEGVDSLTCGEDYDFAEYFG